MAQQSIRFIKAAVQYILLIAFSVLLALGMFEIALRTGWFDDKGTIWIQDKYRKINDDINNKNWATANKNPYGFTDIPRGKKKADGVYRIAVLGDSFVWGGSLPYEQAWGHKLARKITERYPQIEVINWGKNGWSTLDELAFLETEGIKFNVDLLLVGFVRNDPDMGNYPWRLYDLRKSPKWYVQAALYPVRKLFPNVYEFSTAYLNEFLMNYVFTGYGWNTWYQYVYSPENLQRYSDILRGIANLCQTNKIDVLFVLTPASYDSGEEKKFDAIIPLLQQANIPYINLFPAVARDLSHYRPRQLWANLADGHPGPIMTELFANEVMTYLEQHGKLAVQRR